MLWILFSTIFVNQAQNIGGVRKVLKPSSKGFEVVELPNPSAIENTSSNSIETITTYKDDNDPINAGITNERDKKHETETTSQYKEHALQAERNLIAELLLVSDMGTYLGRASE